MKNLKLILLLTLFLDINASSKKNRDTSKDKFADDYEGRLLDLYGCCTDPYTAERNFSFGDENHNKYIDEILEKANDNHIQFLKDQGFTKEYIKEYQDELSLRRFWRKQKDLEYEEYLNKRYTEKGKVRASQNLQAKLEAMFNSKLDKMSNLKK
jgi:hypothetical protein